MRETRKTSSALVIYSLLYLDYQLGLQNQNRYDLPYVDSYTGNELDRFKDDLKMELRTTLCEKFAPQMRLTDCVQELTELRDFTNIQASRNIELLKAINDAVAREALQVIDGEIKSDVSRRVAGAMLNRCVHMDGVFTDVQKQSLRRAHTEIIQDPDVWNARDFAIAMHKELESNNTNLTIPTSASDTNQHSITASDTPTSSTSIRQVFDKVQDMSNTNKVSAVVVLLSVLIGSLVHLGVLPPLAQMQLVANERYETWIGSLTRMIGKSTFSGKSPPSRLEIELIAANTTVDDVEKQETKLQNTSISEHLQQSVMSSYKAMHAYFFTDDVQWNELPWYVRHGLLYCYTAIRDCCCQLSYPSFSRSTVDPDQLRYRSNLLASICDLYTFVRSYNISQLTPRFNLRNTSAEYGDYEEWVATRFRLVAAMWYDGTPLVLTPHVTRHGIHRTWHTDGLDTEGLGFDWKNKSDSGYFATTLLELWGIQSACDALVHYALWFEITGKDFDNNATRINDKTFKHRRIALTEWANSWTSTNLTNSTDLLSLPDEKAKCVFQVTKHNAMKPVKDMMKLRVNLQLTNKTGEMEEEATIDINLQE